MSDQATQAAEEQKDTGINPLTQHLGAQIALTGPAQAAARGETHGSIVENTEAREKAMADGHVVDGATRDSADQAPAEAVVEAQKRAEVTKKDDAKSVKAETKPIEQGDKA